MTPFPEPGSQPRAQLGILLFGGTFDPIHHGHLIVARFAAERLGISRVTLIPAAEPPHKRAAAITPVEDRLAMCRLAVAGDSLFEVSDCEAARGGRSYTIQTIEQLRSQAGSEDHFFWLIGADSLHELPTWFRAQELVELCTMVTVARPGFELGRLETLRPAFSEAQILRLRSHVLETPEIDISATEIRARVAAGKSTRYLTPDAVERYIAEHGLYRGGG